MDVSNFTVIVPPIRPTQIAVTNHATIATIDAPNGSKALLPLTVNDGWQMIPINLAACVRAIWGTEYQLTEQVRVKANCAFRKAFMCAKQYSDIELPEYLRALS